MLVQTPPFLQAGCSLGEEDGFAGEAKDNIGPAPRRAHLHQLRGRKRTVATDKDRGVGPVATQRGQQAHQDHGIFGSRGAGTRPQGGGDECMGGAFHKEQRQAIMILIVLAIKGELLLPIRGIIGMVPIKGHRLGRCWVTRNQVVDQSPRETIQVFTVSLVFQTGEGRRAGSVLRGVPGRPLEPSLKGGARRRLLAS